MKGGAQGKDRAVVALGHAAYGGDAKAVAVRVGLGGSKAFCFARWRGIAARKDKKPVFDGEGKLDKSLARFCCVVHYVGQQGAQISVHEFDYGVERFLELRGQSAFPWLSCNFTDLSADKPVLAPYEVKDMGGIKMGFVDISTPETLSKADPTFFVDETGKDRYGFRQGGDGQELYDCVQRAVDGARSEGAKYIVASAIWGTAA